MASPRAVVGEDTGAIACAPCCSTSPGSRRAWTSCPPWSRAPAACRCKPRRSPTRWSAPTRRWRTCVRRPSARGARARSVRRLASPGERERQVVAVGVDLGAHVAAGAVVPDLAVSLVAAVVGGAGEAVTRRRQRAAQDGDRLLDRRYGAHWPELAVLAVDDLALGGDGDVPEADVGHRAKGGRVGARRAVHLKRAGLLAQPDDGLAPVVVGHDVRAHETAVPPAVVRVLAVGVDGHEGELDREVPGRTDGEAGTVRTEADPNRADPAALTGD